jgi:threonine/homoserine/homoserine lactone efflux protein
VLLTIFLSSFIVALSGALMPGPLLTATISESSRRGMIAGPLLIVGHGFLEICLLVALWLGLAPYLQDQKVFAIIAVSGALMLFWMALTMFRSLPELRLVLDKKASGGGRLVATGALLSLANPYWSIWWATIGLGYIVQSLQFGLRGVLFFFCGHILADLVWYGVVSAMVARGRQLLTDRLYRGLIAGCALFLLIFGCWFGYAGLAGLIGLLIT